MPADARQALRPYQEEARAAVASRIAAGRRALLTVLPTGTGKTVLFAAEVVDRTRDGGRALVLAHRDELIRQPTEALRRAAPGLEVGTVKAERNEVGCRVVVASVPTLARPERLDALRAAGPLALVITDEAHHAVAPMYGRIYAALAAGKTGGPLHLGYTATPQRGDGAGLSDVFEEVAFSRDIRQMVTEGWLTEPRGRIVAAGLALDGVRRNDSGDYSDTGLDEAMGAPAVEAIAQAWWRHARDRVTVAFTPSVRTAQALADAANRVAGAPVAAEVDGGTDPGARRALLASFKAGDVRLLANCGVLTEGFDAPNITCVLVARPTRSEGLYTQMVGRGLRLWPGKTDCLVLDVTGESAHFSLCVLPTLFGLPARDLAGRSVSEAMEEAAAEARRGGLHLARMEADVGLLQRRCRWAWVEVEAGRLYSVDLGRDAAGLAVMAVVRALYRGRAGPWTAEVRRIRDGRTEAAEVLWQGEGDRAAEDAFGAAETWLATQPAAARLASAERGWRSATGAAPATAAQIDALRKWRIVAPDGCTKAHASDLLARAIAAVRLRGA